MSNFSALSMIVVAAVVLSCYYVTPTIGACVMNVVDAVLFGFRWLGFTHPIACAAMYGAAIGACAGGIYACRRSGHRALIRPIAIAALALTLSLALAGGLYRAVMKPTVSAAPAAAVAATL